MEDLSLHILDIAENSIIANAKNVEIIIDEDIKKDLLTIEINDDGSGMNKEMINKITDPFVTSRTTRRVGLGIPLLKGSAEMANGNLVIKSQVNVGTKVKATFQYSNIDRKPLGNIKETLVSLIVGNPDVNFRYVHKYNGQTFEFDTKKMKEELLESNVNTLAVLSYVEKNLKKNSLNY